MTRLLLSSFALLALTACASSESAEKEDAAPAAAAEAAPAPEPEGASECELARVHAKAEWRKQFSRVPDLGPADRDMMAEEHSQLPESELAELEKAAQEGGDEIQLEAIAATRKANAACEG